jgi:hypothetical protein
MHQRSSRGPLAAALVIVIVVLAAFAGSAKAWTTTSPGTVQPGGTFGQTSCPQLSGPNFQQQGDFCFYFPNGSTTPQALCDPSSCGAVTFLFPSAGTFTATLTYPSPNGFNMLGLQLCHDNQAVGDPATCPQVLAPGGVDAGCTQEFATGDNGTPLDPTDDTMTTTLTCIIPVGDTVNPYTLIVFPYGVLNCTDPSDFTCATDFMNGVTAALSGSFSSVIVSPGPADAKAEGGGDVAPQHNFSFEARNMQSKWDHTHVRFAIASQDPTRCSFTADGATFVDIEPTPMSKSGGTADIYGNGTVIDSLKVKHPVTYHLRVTDGGKGGVDTFALTAPGCDTGSAPLPVQHGNINIRQPQ